MTTCSAPNRAFGKRALLAGACAASLALGAFPGRAAAAEPPKDLEEVIVTGSRVKSNGFDAPNPVTVLTFQQISNLGQVNVSETLAIMPQNLAAQSDTNAGPGTRANPNVGSTFANLRGLNPFYGTRTLTLVDSRRFVPTSDGGAVDLNMIPTALISRVETVTGGASAAYGSDAVAGVVNIILDTKLSGVKLQLDFGQTFRGEGDTWHGQVAGGRSFMGGRGHIVASAEYQKTDGIGECALERAWCAESWDVFSNAGITVNGVASGYNVVGSPTYGQPNFVLGPNSKAAYNVASGVIRSAATTPAALRNQQFNDAGTAISPFDPGLYVQTTQIGPRQGGDGQSTFDDSDLRTPTERTALFTHARFDLTETIQGFVELSYGKRIASSTGTSSGPPSQTIFAPDNAFLPPAVRAALVGSVGLTLGKDLDRQFSNKSASEAETYRGVVGLKGDLPFGNWGWDAYYQYGENSRFQSIDHSRVNSFFNFAIDAVVNPANGQIVCRAVLQGNPAAAGCVPANLFGADTLSQGAIAYAWRPAIEDFHYTQNVLAGNVQGDLFKGVGAGPFGAAAGLEYRVDSGNVTHGNVPYYDQFSLSFGLDYGGEIKVLEGYAELNAPLLRGQTLAHLLELNGAVRQTKNESTENFSGKTSEANATSWKVSAIYEPVEWLRLRATRSRDIRAAGFRELFSRTLPTDPVSTQGRVNNPYTANAADPTPILLGGNFSLIPEAADTTTFGAIFSPTGTGLRLSADWFQIDISDAVTTPSGQQIINACFNLGTFCDRITFNPAVSGRRDITFIDSRQINLGRFITRGVDFEADYRISLESLGSSWRGAVHVRALATYLYAQEITASPGSPVVDFAGQSGPNAPLGDFNTSPKWIANGTISYDLGPFNSTLNVKYVGTGALSKTLIGPDDAGYRPTLINSINDNTVDDRFYFTLAATYRKQVQGASLELFGVIENLLDTDPPIAPGSTGSVVASYYPTNPIFFDTLGRRFRTGLRLQF